MPPDSPQFLDLELLVGAARQPGLYPVTVITAPAGQASGTLALDPNAADWKSALDAIADRDTTDELLRQFGRRLFDALLADPDRQPLPHQPWSGARRGQAAAVASPHRAAGNLGIAVGIPLRSRSRICLSPSRRITA